MTRPGIHRELVAPAKVAIFVGTILCLVNQTFTSGSALHIALNYLVPFIVSTYSRLSLQRTLAEQSEARKGRTHDASP